jgi:hypothetical protein
MKKSQMSQGTKNYCMHIRKGLSASFSYFLLPEYSN